MLAQPIMLLVLVAALCLCTVSARPTIDELPKLSDTLAVAKSPLEPMTAAPSLPGARNSEPAATIDEQQASEALERTSTTEVHRQTTRSVEIEPVADTISASTSSQQTADPIKSAEQITNETAPLETTLATTEGNLDTSTSRGEPAEEPTNSTSSVEPQLGVSDSDKPLVTTVATEGTSTHEHTSDPGSGTVTENKSAENVTPAPSAEGFPKLDEPSSVGNFKGASSLGQNVSAQPDQDERISTNKEVPSTTTSATTITSTTTNLPVEIEPFSTAVAIAEKELPAETSNTPAPENTSTSTSKPDATTASPTPEPEPEKTTVRLVNEPTIATETTAVPSSTTTGASSENTTGTTTALPAAPITNLESVNNKPEQGATGCDHLPSYGSDEIQKVFREETTFRNGTIKGKFTYINFDQRYRLVHYTRLPYGPVKIDLVEELGRPNQAARANQSSSSTLSDIPNAVLQLRNLLPTSLFGFPFLPPNTNIGSQLQPITGPLSGAPELEADRSNRNMYFYSTNSLAGPGHGLSSPRSSAPSSTFQNLGYDEPNQAYQDGLLGSRQRMLPRLQSVEASNTRRPLQAEQQNQDTLKQHQPSKAIAYDIVSQPPAIVQYSSLQPGIQHQSPPLIFGYDQPRVLTHHHEQHPIHHQAHQPHSHEHYFAPFMFAQPPSNTGAEIDDNSRLRLRVKTSKALHSSEVGHRSAQLRIQSNGIYSPPANSPVSRLSNQESLRSYGSRQRIGKQNHDLKTTNSHSLPVVYHVLRSPAGRTFTLNPSDQGYAIAYDHDN